MSCEVRPKWMNSLISLKATDLVKLLLDEILHGLYVVVGDFLNVFYTLCFCFVEVAVDVA